MGTGWTADGCRGCRREKGFWGDLRRFSEGRESGEGGRWWVLGARTFNIQLSTFNVQLHTITLGSPVLLQGSPCLVEPEGMGSSLSRCRTRIPPRRVFDLSRTSPGEDSSPTTAKRVRPQSRDSRRCPRRKRAKFAASQTRRRTAPLRVLRVKPSGSGDAGLGIPSSRQRAGAA